MNGRTNFGRFEKGNVPWNTGKPHYSIRGENNPAKRPEVREKIRLGNLGKKQSDETRQRIREAQLGKKLSEEHKQKISDGEKKNLPKTVFKKGLIPWNKGLKGTIKHTDAFKKELSLRMKGNKYQLGKKQSAERIAKRIKKGKNHHNWKGGITSQNKLFRCRAEWKSWREKVFKRDNYKCQNPNCMFCNNKIGVLLHPHHIKPLSQFPELSFDVNNGITFCAEFHIKGNLHMGIQKSVAGVA